MELISFATGSRSVNKQDLWKNLKIFQVAEASIQSIFVTPLIRTLDTSRPNKCKRRQKSYVASDKEYNITT